MCVKIRTIIADIRSLHSFEHYHGAVDIWLANSLIIESLHKSPCKREPVNKALGNKHIPLEKAKVGLRSSFPPPD